MNPPTFYKRVSSIRLLDRCPQGYSARTVEPVFAVRIFTSTSLVKFSNRFQSGHFVVRVSTVSIWHGAFGARFGTVARTIQRIQYYFTTVGFGPLRFCISVRRKKALRPVIRARNVFGVRYIRVKFPLAKSELLLVRVGADDVGEFFLTIDSENA